MAELQQYFVILFIVSVQSKVYERCEFVRELYYYGVPFEELAIWSCIAYHESNYNTSAINRNSGDHGIIQISELYWCETGSQPGGGCNAVCAQFEDDYIFDDLVCAIKILDDTRNFKENGFMAWTAYNQHCSGDVSGYIDGCNFSFG